MRKIALLGDPLTNLGPFTPSVIDNSNQNFVTINNIPIATEGGTATTHTNPTTNPQTVHPTPMLLHQNNTLLTINKVEVIVDGDPASCQHPVSATGFVTVS